MPSQPPIPPLLAPYLPLPAFSITLLTSTLSTTPAFLILRFLYSTLSSPKTASANEAQAPHIVLLSWLRDFTFFRDGAKKLGLDLSEKRKVTFIDGLSSGLGLNTEGIKSVEKSVLDAVHTAKEGEEGNEKKVIVIIDGLDFLLAATETRVEAMLDMIAEVREVHLFLSHHSIVALLTCSLAERSCPVNNPLS